MYVGFNPPQGTSKVYRYEDFTNGTPSFKLISEINPNPSVYVIPQNYRGKTGDALSDVASLNGYPQLASKIDVYNSWLAENSGIISVQKSQAETNALLDIYSNAIGMFSGIGNMALSGATGGESGNAFGGFGAATGGAISIARTAANYDYFIKMLNAQQERQALLPDNVTLGGSNATLLGYDLLDNNIFTTYTIKYQFAKRIDDYFSMYRIPNK